MLATWTPTSCKPLIDASLATITVSIVLHGSHRDADDAVGMKVDSCLTYGNHGGIMPLIIIDSVA